MSTDMRQTTIFGSDVSQKIQSLLERCSNIRRARDLHVTFDAKGEAAARRIAAADLEGTTQLQRPPLSPSHCSLQPSEVPAAF